MSDKIVSDHLFSFVSNLLGCLAYLYASLEPGGEFALAPATGLNLCLKNQATLVTKGSSYLSRLSLIKG